MTHHEKSHAAREASLDRRLERVPATARAMGAEEEHRRDVLMERAGDRGLDRPEAEQAYDLACEERLDPGYGLALVLEGVSVQPFSSPRPDVDTSDSNEPEWVDAPPDPALAARERRLRQTFRRFRSHLEKEGDLSAALRAFAREPDLEVYDY